MNDLAEREESPPFDTLVGHLRSLYSSAVAAVLAKVLLVPNLVELFSALCLKATVWKAKNGISGCPCMGSVSSFT